MSVLAGWGYAGMFCKRCDQEVQPTDRVTVDEAGEPDGEGGWIDQTTVQHADPCPEEDV